MRIGVSGDCHGQQKLMMKQAAKAELDVLFQVGDMEAVPNRKVHRKSRGCKIRDFADYYDGTETAEIPVLFIGGNHEPYQWMDGHDPDDQGIRWLAPNWGYLGRAGAAILFGMRVAWLSGVYRKDSWDRDRESYPRSVSFNRVEAKRTLKMGRSLGRIDLLLLHDWPEIPTTVGYGRRAGRRGNPVARWLVDELRPSMVCCGHKHIRWSGRLKTSRIEALATVGSRSDSLLVMDDSEPENRSTCDTLLIPPHTRPLTSRATGEEARRA